MKRLGFGLVILSLFVTGMFCCGEDAEIRTARIGGNRKLLLTGARISSARGQSLEADFIQVGSTNTNSILVRFPSHSHTPHETTLMNIIVSSVNWTTPADAHRWHKAESEVVFSAPTNSVGYVTDLSRWFLVGLRAGLPDYSVRAELEQGNTTPSASVQTQQSPWDRYGQEIFFAVLEGLYRDGVSNDVVDLILAPDPKTGEPDMRKNFVYACPLCHPAFEAFRLYRTRNPFLGLKGRKDTFGAGLDDATIKGLKSPTDEERRAALEKLIQRWVAQRLDSMRLTAEERAEWTRQIDQRRKEGMKQLESFTSGKDSRHAGWEVCPSCDGSAATVGSRK